MIGTTHNHRATGHTTDRLVASLPSRTTNSPLYNAWEGMKQRCHNPRNPRFPRYGGRGISVCERWRNSFAAFAEDMGPKPTPKHSVDRINNDGNYEPSNCRWATSREQYDNRDEARGSRLPQALLTEAGVYAIRRVWALKIFTSSELAKWFGVTRAAIGSVTRRTSWRHVP